MSKAKYSRRIHKDLARNDPTRAASQCLRAEYNRMRYREMIKHRASVVAQVTSCVNYAIDSGRDELADWVY